MKVDIQANKKLLGKPLEVAEARFSYQRFDGEMSDTVTKIIVQRSDAVAAVVFNTDTQQFVFCRQFRYTTYGKNKGWLTEIMAGVMDEGETEEESLRRELEEELGYTPTKTEKIVSFYTAPGYSTEQVHLFYVEVNNASKKSAGGGMADENENIETVCYTIAEVKSIFAANKFCDAKTIIGCQYLINRNWLVN